MSRRASTSSRSSIACSVRPGPRISISTSRATAATSRASIGAEMAIGTMDARPSTGDLFTRFVEGMLLGIE